MKSFPIKFKFALALCLVPTLAFAQGHGAGNGGLGVLCLAADGVTPKTFTMMDLVEGSGYGLPGGNDESYGFVIPESGDAALSSAKKAAIATTEIEGILKNNLKDYPNIQHFIALAIPQIKKSMDPAPADSELVFSNDYGKLHVSDLPKNCKVYQLARYVPNQKMKIDMTIFDLMDSKNQAAFFLHEAIYQLMRNWMEATDSEQSREIVAALMANSTAEDSLLWVVQSVLKMSNVPTDPPLARARPEKTKAQVEVERQAMEKLKQLSALDHQPAETMFQASLGNQSEGDAQLECDQAQACVVGMVIQHPPQKLCDYDYEKMVRSDCTGIALAPYLTWNAKEGLISDGDLQPYLSVDGKSFTLYWAKFSQSVTFVLGGF
jgi:predicted lactoylglutathione lyase